MTGRHRAPRPSPWPQLTGAAALIMIVAAAVLLRLAGAGLLG